MTQSRITYPESTTFKWEAATFTYEDAVFLMDGFAKQGGSDPRRKSYIRAMQLVREADSDDMDSTAITGAALKQILIQAAREVGWWDVSKDRTFTTPPPAAAGEKTCYVCKGAKPVEEFMVAPNPAQIKRYGWKPDTQKKVLNPVCSTCRKARADADRNRQRRRAPQLRALLNQVATPEQAERMQDYERVLAQIRKHQNRVNAAIYQARKALPAVDADTGEESTIYEYQFRDENTKNFYFLKRDLLDIAQHRLDALLGETKPIPAKWGMLLTKEEERRLAFLHDDAFAGLNRVHQLW